MRPAFDGMVEFEREGRVSVVGLDALAAYPHIRVSTPILLRLSLSRTHTREKGAHRRCRK